jgi:hypothetical protein
MRSRSHRNRRGVGIKALAEMFFKLSPHKRKLEERNG